ncbi:hypothetical protein FG386_001946 [Cryptosporidium ryanae]|uniref:uncharacterized protein n=1 Tax=Cryptosporidium ryanae TaxID=515981 RepID=UPI00351AA96D|nr:hypothetical protein FG386_001946 [Cryptosporidium ryanae]
MSSVNIMPFKIKFDGKIVNVKNRGNSSFKDGNSHFLRYVKNINENNAQLSATFRGRRLSGEKINLYSKGLSMLVISGNPMSINSKINVDNKISNLIYWNYDEEAGPSDDIPQVVNFAQFINIIHGET